MVARPNLPVPIGSPAGTGPVRVAAEAVASALEDASRAVPIWVNPVVARSLSRGSARTRAARLERLARVVLSADTSVASPEAVWSGSWERLDVPSAERLDRVIAQTWASPSTRNAMRDSVRCLVRAGWSQGCWTSEERDRLLAALQPEPPTFDGHRQQRGHIPPEEVARVFAALGKDPRLVARRDAALIALLIGCGLRRREACLLMMADLSSDHDFITVTGKGGKNRDVPLAPGVRRAVDGWLRYRGPADGHLLTPISRQRPAAVVERPMSPSAVAKVVHKHFGSKVSPHDLRRTAVGDLLDAGADLSVVARIVGHTNPAVTAQYDRRGMNALRTAVDRLHVPYVPSQPDEADGLG